MGADLACRAGGGRIVEIRDHLGAGELGELQSAVDDENAVVKAVTIWEGPVNSVRYEQTS